MALCRRFTRDEVLSAYLNHLPIRHGIFGNDDDRAMAHVEGGGLPAELFRSDLARYAKAVAPPRPAVAKMAAGW